jgi:hypothetical protein
VIEAEIGNGGRVHALGSLSARCQVVCDMPLKLSLNPEIDLIFSTILKFNSLRMSREHTRLLIAR